MPLSGRERPGPLSVPRHSAVSSCEAQADTLGQRVHVRGTDPLVMRSLYQLKDLDATGVFRRSSDDMHMKVVETLLLSEKQYVRFWDLQFRLEGSRERWNKPPKHGRFIGR